MRVAIPRIISARKRRQVGDLRYSRTEFCATGAFTLVEIAIALGIIGFALVAIIGILPAGLQVQRDNKEDTIINQEGTYLMEAIRNGAEGLDELSSRVTRIVITNVTTRQDDAVYTNDNNQLQPIEVIGLLSTPSEFGQEMREVRAVVRAGVGVAVDAKSDLAFEYQVTIRNLAYTNSVAPPDAQQAVGAYLRDVRLDMRWPMLPGGRVGAGRQVFRQLLSGKLTPDDPNNPRLWLLRQ